jgi:TetR/AcrR family transcriptional regulator
MESTEQKILQAAREEFIKTGLKGARMQEIADRAGVNKALLHYYFRSKEKLYEASIRDVVETLWGTIEKQLAELKSQPDLQKYIRLFVTSYIQTMSANPLFVRIMIREVADGGTILPQLVQKVVSRFGSVPKGMILALAEQIKKGMVKKLNPMDIFLNMMGMCLVTFVMQPIAESLSGQFDLKIEFDEIFYQRRIDSIVEMVCGGIFVKDAR